MADAAARRAGVMAYWVGCSCMPDNQLQEDVRNFATYRFGTFELIQRLGLPYLRRDSRRPFSSHCRWKPSKQLVRDRHTRLDASTMGSPRLDVP